MRTLWTTLAIATTLGCTIESEQERAAEPQSTFAASREVEISMTNSVGMEFVLIPPGEFLMGSTPDDTDADADERPQHKVRITKPFLLQTTEVTQGQWRRVMDSAPWQSQLFVKEGSDQAASYISHEDAELFCRRLSEIETREYRLPTEAEWEYAARAGTTTSYSFGDDSVALENHGWFLDNAGGANEEFAHAVGRKLPNAWGLHDVHGNVWEACSDWFGEAYFANSPENDPTGPTSGETRVLRGGSWGNRANGCRSWERGGQLPDDRSFYVGFRVLCYPLN